MLLSSCSGKKHAQKEEVTIPQGLFDLQFGDLFLKGCEQRMKGNLIEAIKLFEECKRYYPNEPALQYELAMVHQLLGHKREALDYAKKAAAADSNNEWYLQLLAACYGLNGQHAQATKVKEQLVQKWPARTDLREDLAEHYISLNQRDKALAIYKQLQNEFGPKESIMMNQIKLLAEMNRFNEAEAALQLLVKNNPNELQYLSYLAAFYEDRLAFDKAKGVYEELLKRDPENVVALLAMHDYYLSLGQTAQAEGYLVRTFACKDLDQNVALQILSTYVGQANSGNKQAAELGVKLATQFSAVHPESPVGFAILGDLFSIAGKKSEAADAYTKAAAHETRDFRVWENLLSADNETRRFDSLIVHGVRATELFPTHSVFYLYLSSALVQKKRYKEAIEYLETGRSYLSGNNETMLEFWRLLGDAYHYNAKHDLSDKAFDEALKINPDNTYVLNNYAYYLSLRGEKLDLAERLSKHSLQLQPEEANFQDTYAWVLYKLGKYQEAEVYIAKAAAKSPSPAILEHWGDIAFKLNKKEEAVAKWKAAKAAGNKSEVLEKKINEQKLPE